MARRHWVLIALGVVVGAAAAFWTLRERPDAWLEGAQQAARRREFDRARQFLVRYLRADPNSYAARLLMAQVARRAGFLHEASVQRDVAEALQGQTDAVALEHALAETQQGDLINETPLLERVNADSAAAPLILEALARGYRKNYLLDNMHAALSHLLELQTDNADALIERAWIYEHRLDWTKALEDCRRAAALDPRHDEARLRIGQLLLLMEKPAEALEELAQLLTRRPADPRVALGVFQACRKLGKSTEASRLESELALQYPKEFSVLLERGRYLLEQNQATAAESVLRDAVAQAPFDYQARFTWHLCLRQLGSAKEADEQLGRVQQLEADLKQMSELTEKLQKARFDPDLRCAIGKIFLRTGEEQEGLAWLKTVLRLHPGHAPTHRALADYYEQRRQPGLAEHYRSLGGK